MFHHLMRGQHSNKEACHLVPYGERWPHQDYLGDAAPSAGLTLVTCHINPSRSKAILLKLFPQSVVSLFRYQSVTFWSDVNKYIVTQI